MSNKPDTDDLREEYDFTAEDLRGGLRGKYTARYAEGVNVVTLDPDVAAVFPDSASVNRALRALAQIIKDQSSKPAA